ncbi:MAG: type IV pilus modification protein PilV, partial [Comamonadaceae bacterium]
MNPKASSPFNSRQIERGFSMIEVLVTLLVISLALLGTAGLQAYAMRLNQGGQFRTQAVFLAADLAERIEANKSGAMAGNYDKVAGDAATYKVVLVTNDLCLTANCAPVDLATYDLAQWQSAVQATLPQSSWTVQQTVNGSAKTDTQACTPSTYTITLRWVDRLTDTKYETAVSASQFGSNGTGEKFSYV